MLDTITQTRAKRLKPSRKKTKTMARRSMIRAWRAKDIELVMAQASVSRKKAVKALKVLHCILGTRYILQLN